MKKRSLWLSAAGALGIAVALAGCGSTTYFAGRQLPPSGLPYRVMIAIQNPGALTKGALQIVDAQYDTRFKYNNINVTYSISGFAGALPISIQNMPEEQVGGVYGSGDGSYSLVNYAKETSVGAKGISGLYSSIYLTRNENYLIAASQANHVVTVASPTSGSSISFGLPGVYAVSVNPGGTVALAFVQNSNYIYYLRQLTAAQSIAYSGGSSTWPRAAQDCEPQNAPSWCLFQAQSPDSVDSTGNAYGAPLSFDRPVKAVFSSDGGTAYILNCGPECGGTAASVSLLPTAPMIFTSGQQSGSLPTTGNITTIPVPGGASNALVSSSTMYVVGQQLLNDGLFTGNLTVLNLNNNTVSHTASISDGTPGGPSRLILADDNTLWIAMTKCNNGERYAQGEPYGCLTMYNTSSNTVTMLEPYLGDATGIAAVATLHKVYVAQGGQVYIYSTTDGSAINNQYVTVTGTAWDVAFMDATTDANNTVY
ncbi:MAG TPA: hypothetical protein VG893_08250 [Terracidiphilus sp.]|nr:hypothetical protein [Terracidiphilus sp.]